MRWMARAWRRLPETEGRRKTTGAIIPGSMEAVYDLRRGLLHELHFDPDGCVGEIHMFEAVRRSIPTGSLLLNDRYYAKPQDLAGSGRAGAVHDQPL